MTFHNVMTLAFQELQSDLRNMTSLAFLSGLMYAYPDKKAKHAGCFETNSTLHLIFSSRPKQHQRFLALCHIQDATSVANFTSSIASVFVGQKHLKKRFGIAGNVLAQNVEGTGVFKN